ncbi:MAG: GNAT family N-acetyltransferase [Chloroflexi bacterium]|nr:GNAT family N-acetyltransferase [Chloroflexota bacterium]
MDRSARPPTIRPGRPEDYPLMNRIAAASDVQIDAPEGPGQPYVDRLFAEGTVLVAERDGTAVGFAAAVWIQPAAGSDGPRVQRRSHVSDLFVEPSAQGSGVGGPLYRALLEAHADDRWSVSSSNDPRAQALYVAGGMAPAWPLYYLRRLAASSERPLPRVGATSVRPLTPADAVAATASISGYDRTLDIATWTSRAGSTAFAVELEGETALVGFARDDGPTGRWLDAAFVAEAADPEAALVAALDSDVLSRPGSTLTLCLGAPHPAVWTLLGAGFIIVELDRWFESPEGLVDPARVVPDPSVG